MAGNPFRLRPRGAPPAVPRPSPEIAPRCPRSPRGIGSRNGQRRAPAASRITRDGRLVQPVGTGAGGLSPGFGRAKNSAMTVLIGDRLRAPQIVYFSVCDASHFLGSDSNVPIGRSRPDKATQRILQPCHHIVGKDERQGTARAKGE